MPVLSQDHYRRYISNYCSRLSVEAELMGFKDLANNLKDIDFLPAPEIQLPLNISTEIRTNGREAHDLEALLRNCAVFSELESGALVRCSKSQINQKSWLLPEWPNNSFAVLSRANSSGLSHRLDESLGLLFRADSENYDLVCNFAPHITAIELQDDNHKIVSLSYFSGSNSTIIGCPHLVLGKLRDANCEMLIHEAQHALLFIAELVFPFTETETKDFRYYSPWQETPRAIYGVAHAVSVFGKVFEFYLRSIRSDQLLVDEVDRCRKRAAVLLERIRIIMSYFQRFQNIGQITKAIMNESEVLIHAEYPEIECYNQEAQISEKKRLDEFFKKHPTAERP